MKGIIYRNIVNNKKSFLAMLVVCIAVFYFMGENISQEDTCLYLSIYTFTGCVVVYSIAEYVFDVKKNNMWKLFLDATPLENKKIVGAYFLLDYIYGGFGVLCSLVVIAFSLGRYQIPVKMEAFQGIIYAVCIILLYGGMKKLFSFTENKWIETVGYVVMIGAFILFGAAVNVLYFGVKVIGLPWYLAICLLVCLSLHYVCYKVSVEIYGA